MLASLFITTLAGAQTPTPSSSWREFGFHQGLPPAFWAVLHRKDGTWAVSSLGRAEGNSRDFRAAIRTEGGEILLARRDADQRWVFEPFFDIAPPALNGRDYVRCRRTLPYDFPRGGKFDKLHQTNMCDSLFMTDAAPSRSPESMAGHIARSAAVALMTSGISLIAQAATIGDERYLHRAELTKAIEDTQLDELLSSISADLAEVSLHVRRINQERDRKVAGIRTDLRLNDRGGWASALNSLDFPVRSLVTYRSVKNVALHHLINDYPVSLAQHEIWRRQWRDAVERLDADPASVVASCPAGSFLLKRTYRLLIDCPRPFQDTGAEISLPVDFTGVDVELAPTVMAADARLKVQLDAGILKFENLTGEFIEIRDISLGVNSDVVTLSNPTGSSHLTLGPKSVYPRTGESGKFSFQSMADAKMRGQLVFTNLSLSDAKAAHVRLTLAVRYVTENTTATRTIRGTQTVNVHDMIIADSKR